MLLRSGVTAAALPSLYLGQVATNCHLYNNRLAATSKQMQVQSGHYARDDITSLQIGAINWALTSGNAFVDGGLIDTYSASLIYPDTSTRAQFLWSGASSTSLAAGATLVLSDPLPCNIHRGDAFGIGQWIASTAGNIPVNDSFGNGAKSNSTLPIPTLSRSAASGLTDVTMGGTLTAGSSSIMHSPALLVAQTRRGSVLIISDSRGDGTFDTQDISGDTGNIARSIGPDHAYLAAAFANVRMQTVAANPSRFLTLAPYFSHGFVGLGVNDCNSRTLAQIQSDYGSFIPSFKAALLGGAGGGVMGQTLEPQTTSAANTTPHASTTVRQQFNPWIAGWGGLNAVADIYSPVGNNPDNGLWKVTGDQQDGTHENHQGYQKIKDSGVVNAAFFTR